MKRKVILMKKWYNVEIPYTTREDIRRAEAYKAWLTDNGIRFESSSAGNMLHFETLLDPEGVKRTNAALDDLVWFDAITPC